MAPVKKRLSKTTKKTPLYVVRKRKNPLEALPLSKWAAWSIGMPIVMLVASLGFIYLLPPEIPLFYGASEVGDQIADSWKIVIPSLVALVAAASNILLAIVIQSDFLKRTLVVASIAISLLATITTLKIFFLVATI